MEKTMSIEKELENVLRTFLKDEVMMTQIDFMALEDELTLDSLAQTELRVFLEEKYGLDISMDAMPVETTATLSALISHIAKSSKEAA